jgi:hypothetical protein
VANAVTAWVPLFVVATMVEPPRRKLEGSHRENARVIVRALLCESGLLRAILCGLMAYGLATLLLVWAVQDYWRLIGVPLEWFGVLWAAYNLTVAISGAGAHRMRRNLGVRGVVLLIGALPVLGYGGMALCSPASGGEVGLAVAAGGVLLGLLFQLSRGLTQVVLRDELNRRVETSMRATANSVSSLGVRLCFAGLGPLLGWLIDGHGHRVALGSFGAGYAVVGLVLAVPLALALGRAGASPTAEG